ncbi:DNA alkylation repair protein [Novipirellula sp. SH528]|uniref:DNA alkylation repair protein n=1 Tax=Novipirellula sp. SH528 TaxID=3454466 RepID=UPI003FA07FB8
MTAPKILGTWLAENPCQRDVLDRLAASDVLWERRVAVLATFALIQNEEFSEIINQVDRFNY